MLTLFLLGALVPALAAESGAGTVDPRIVALEKANEALANAHLSNEGTVVITSRKGYLVVSYLETDPRARGGRAHVVYDPRLGKVVHVLGED
jgi:hypothetical protein